MQYEKAVMTQTPSIAGAAAPGAAALRPALLITGILLVAANLRAAITVVGPLLNDVRGELHISAAVAAALISLPVLCFAVFSPIAAPIAARVGMERTIVSALALLATGIIMRSVPSTAALWTGTVVLGAALAAINVTLPALLKRDFPRRAGQLTGLYASVQSGAAAAASGLAVPVAGMSDSGWRIAFGMWSGLALVALAVFLPQLRRRTVPKHRVAAALDPHPSQYRSPWGSSLGWQVTIFMGAQSTIYYVVLTWWPTIEHSQGFSAATAGFHQGILQISGVVGSLLCGSVLHRWHSDQRLIAVCVTPLPLVAILGQFAWPGAAVLWTVIVGLATSATLVLALTLFGLRTSHHGQAAALSGMAQSGGYVMAGTLPLAFGALHDATQGWYAPVVLLIVLVALQVVFGYLAARPKTMDGYRQPHRAPK